jgi:S1-C subfamily serine protease
MKDQSVLRKYMSVLCLGLFIVSLPLSAPASAADDLRLLRAQAIRRAAQVVAPSLVRVERFGVAEAGGEVSDDAPTVALSIDDKRHFISSSLVSRQSDASIVLVAEDGRRSTAKIVASDVKRQIVLLEAAEDLGVKPVELASAESEVGQTVVAVGRIAGDGSLAVSSGVLSAKERLWGIALQTDARVSSVFYGGALVDLRGRLLGVLIPAVPEDMGEDVTAWYDAGVAFAIPSDAISERLPIMLEGKDIHAGLMGIVAKSNDPYVESTEIAAVRPRSPAARADIQAGDVVLSIAGQPVKSHREIKQILGAKDAGQEVTIELQRKDDEKLSKSVTLAQTIPPLTPQWIGIAAEDRPSGSDEKPEGVQVVVTGVFDGSPASDKLKTGDVISSIDGGAIADVASLRRRVFAADPEQPLKVSVFRDGEAVDVSFQTSDVSAQIPTSVPDVLTFDPAEVGDWAVTDLALPDLGNKAVIVAPEIKEQANAQERQRDDLGVMLLLADPGEVDLQKIATPWLASAQAAGVIVCVVAPANEDRWQPDEIDAATRIVASIRKRYPVNPLMAVVAGAGTGAGGSMAMAAAIGRPGVFSGLAVSPEVTPPAIRLRENDPSAPLQLLLRGATSPDEPSWAATLVRTGFAVLRADNEDETVLRWVRALPRI